MEKMLSGANQGTLIMRNVLVIAASKHGSTLEIAEAIAVRIRSAGLEADVREPVAVNSLDEHDAVVLGSAVYASHWLPAALDVIDRFGDEFATRPVWLFSSGPVGEQPLPESRPNDVDDLAASIGARDHKIFAGSIDKEDLGLGERAVVKLLRAPIGDYRDWKAIRRWAGGIAKALSTTVNVE